MMSEHEHFAVQSSITWTKSLSALQIGPDSASSYSLHQFISLCYHQTWCLCWMENTRNDCFESRVNSKVSTLLGVCKWLRMITMTRQRCFYLSYLESRTLKKPSILQFILPSHKPWDKTRHNILFAINESLNCTIV